MRFRFGDFFVERKYKRFKKKQKNMRSIEKEYDRMRENGRERKKIRKIFKNKY